MNKKCFMLIWVVFVLSISLFPADLVSAEKSREYLRYDNEMVKLDIYNPRYNSCPVVILIHGAAGIKGDRAVRYSGFATDLMNKGIIAINVHYFDSQRKNWIRTIIQAIDYASSIPNANKYRIGLAGYSLGGTIALSVASIDNRIKSLAINSGYLPSGFDKEKAAKLPKTFMISGSKDTSIHTLNTLRHWFTEFGKPFKTKINDGLGHNNVPMSIFKQDWNSIVEFFVKNL